MLTLKRDKQDFVLAPLNITFKDKKQENIYASLVQKTAANIRQKQVWTELSAVFSFESLTAVTSKRFLTFPKL